MPRRLVVAYSASSPSTATGTTQADLRVTRRAGFPVHQTWSALRTQDVTITAPDGYSRGSADREPTIPAGPEDVVTGQDFTLVASPTISGTARTAGAPRRRGCRRREGRHRCRWHVRLHRQ